MEGNMIMRMLLMMLVTSWMWCGAMSVDDGDVSFSTDNASAETYADFFTDLRAKLGSGISKHGFLILRQKKKVPTVDERFLKIGLTNSNGDSITLALDVVDAQVVAYQTTDEHSFFFKDPPKPQSDDLFLDTERTTFKFTASYADLAQVAGAERDSIALGMTPLSDAIHDLYVWKSGSQKNLATGLIVIIQMVAEATKIPYIQRAVANRGLGDEDFTPDCAVISYEDKWEALSSAILTSVNGKFRNPVGLQRGNCKDYNATQVTENLINDVALLKSNVAISTPSQGIRSVVAAEDEENIKELVMALRKFNPGRHNKWFTMQA